MGDISKFIPDEIRRRNSGEPMNFFKAYCDAIVRILKLTESELKLFLAMSIKAEFNTNRIKVDSEFKQWFINTSDFTDKTIKNALLSLDKKGIIKKVNKEARDGLYLLNKDYVFRGSVWEKADSISFTETHHKDGSTTYHVDIHVELKREPPKHETAYIIDTPFPEDNDT